MKNSDDKGYLGEEIKKINDKIIELNDRLKKFEEAKLTGNPIEEHLKYLNSLTIDLSETVSKLEKRVKKLSKVETPFGYFLHNPLFFVSAIFFGFLLSCVFYFFIDRKDYDTLRQEYKAEIEKQKNDIIHYVDQFCNLSK